MSDYDKFRMRVELQTHCPICGGLAICTGLIDCPNPTLFKSLMLDMKTSLNNYQCSLCKKPMDELSTEWVEMWQE